ncbi:cytochrome c biogenesis heme-transporting ATPase CcmA [Enterobacteriaceae bacterium RIT714]|nr:cytochrome c biogenesis heme-transporting ATPase CcmA [Enterobacteriaceae bacterium RIT714]
MENRLDVLGLCCERDDRYLFRDLSFSVSPGEWVQIAGGNGAGKTTLLRMLTGIIRPDSGEVRWQTHSVNRHRDRLHAHLLWMGHQPGIKTRLTALQNIAFFHPDASRSEHLTALGQVGLGGYEDVPVATLSAGQQRNVAMARLWLTRAALWILDEPFTAIDAAGIARLTRRMAQHVSAGGQIVMTTHQPLADPGLPVRQVALTGGVPG